MPTSVFESQPVVDTFTTALRGIGGQVTDVLPCPPMFIVRYELPKKHKRRADIKEQVKADKAREKKKRKTKKHR